MKGKVRILLSVVLSLVLFLQVLPVSLASAQSGDAQNTLTENRIREFADLRSILVRDNGNPLPKDLQVLAEFKYLPLKLVAIKELKDIQKIQRLGFKTYFNVKYTFAPITLKDLKDPEISKVIPKLEGKFKAGENYPYLGTFPTFLNESAKIIGADKMWEMGFTGKGVVIAIIDTGIDKTHPLLDDMDDDPETDDPKVIDEISFAKSDKSVEDKFAHGTAVAAIAAGTGGAAGNKFYSSFWDQMTEAEIAPYTQKGIAPGAKLLNIKVVEDEGYAFVSSIIKGIEYAIDHGADVINISLGGIPMEDNPMHEAIRIAAERGVVVVQSAGNEGPGHFSTGNGSPEAISVGGIYETEKPIFFSSRGPYSFGLYAKPDVVAPAAEIVSAMPLNLSRRYFGEDLLFLSNWGTSFSAPHGAGSAALLLGAFPGASPIAIKAAMIKGARPKDGYDYSQIGAGIINIPNARQVLKESGGEPQKYSISQKTIEANRVIAQKPLTAVFLGDNQKYRLFLEELTNRGIKIEMPWAKKTDADIELGKYDLLIIGQPDAEIGKLKEKIESFVKEGGKILFIGDADIIAYNKLFKEFGIKFFPGLSYGGEATKFADHPITKGLSMLFFGSAIASFGAKPDLVKPIVFDKGNFPLAVVFTSQKSKMVLISEDSLLSDEFLKNEKEKYYDNLKKDKPKKNDNLQFGINAVRWLVQDDSKSDFRELALGAKHNSYFLAGNENKVSFTVFNDGGKDEKVKLTVTEAIEVEEEKTASKTVSKEVQEKEKTASETVSKEVQEKEKTNSKTVSKAEYEFTVPSNGSKETTVVFKPSLDKKTSVQRTIIQAKVELADQTADEVMSSNNLVEFTVLAINKINREGVNPEVTMITPNRIDSFSPPTITRFPGDFKVLNLSIFTSKELADATMKIENLDGLVSFTKAENLALYRSAAYWNEELKEPVPYVFVYGKEYDAGLEKKIGKVRGTILVPIQIIAQRPGEYSGEISLYDGSKKIVSVPVQISVVEPKAKLLYDDIFDYYVDETYSFFGHFKGYLDNERLWGGIDVIISSGRDVYDYWKALSRAGYRVNSLAQVAHDSKLTIASKKTLFDLAPNYQAVIIHDKEGHTATISQWEKVLEKTNIIANFDSDSYIIFTGLPWQQSVQADELAGIGLLFFEQSEIGNGLKKDKIPFIGGVSYGLLGENTERVAWIGDNNGAPIGGGVVSLIYTAPSGHKEFIFGDSVLFEAMSAPDLAWIFFKVTADRTDIAGWEDEAEVLVGQIADYTVKPGQPYLSPEEKIEEKIKSAQESLQESLQESMQIQMSLRWQMEQAARENKRQQQSLQAGIDRQSQRIEDSEKATNSLIEITSQQIDGTEKALSQQTEKLSQDVKSLHRYLLLVVTVAIVLIVGCIVTSALVMNRRKNKTH